MSKFIIIEGTDNVGKDTQQDLIIKNMSNHVFHKLHYSSLPFKDDKDKHAAYSKDLYETMFQLMIKSKSTETKDDLDINIIFNRSHLGESIYSPLYRGYSGDYVFDIEKKYTKALREELYLITLVNDPHTILKRDDGKSFYGNEEEVKAEVDGFTRAHRKSTIKNKLLINVGTMSAIEVSNILIEFLQHENTVTGDNKQLNMFK
jgi:thymidylate kinase|tara:strand:+ start:1544 stop:2155 length:612 start_codon:yes stop_codon:yes gene_type:complete